MRAVSFTKMDGAGNDFIVFTDPPPDPLDADMVGRLCDRQRGIGADGVLVVGGMAPDRVSMRYLNRDGSEAFCGNGARCAARFAHVRGLVGETMTLETVAGPLAGRVDADGTVTVTVPGPLGSPERLDFGDVRSGLQGDHVVVGVPHLVISVSDAASFPLTDLGPRLRQHPRVGPDGANVDVVEWRGPHEVVLRTYERGVEAETLACGSGAVAAVVCRAGGAPDGSVRVWVRSGEALLVTRRDPEVTLSGTARIVFEGTIEWPPSGKGEGPRSEI